MTKFFIGYLIFTGFIIIYLLIQVEQLKSKEIIRTRGIIITDSAGRDRILIGAPFPFSADRVRTDTTQVRKHWAARYEKEPFMDWYEQYHHGGNGILIMNGSGFDKIMLGDDLNDPNTGQRNGRPTGLLWNDDLGFEKGGLGLNRLKENGLYRNILGFDDNGGEAFHLGLLEDGSKFIRMAWSDTTLLIGKGTPGNFLFNTQYPFVGLQLKSAKNQKGYQENWVKGEN